MGEAKAAELFTVLADETTDNSTMEQMALILGYLDKDGLTNS